MSEPQTEHLGIGCAEIDINTPVDRGVAAPKRRRQLGEPPGQWAVGIGSGGGEQSGCRGDQTEPFAWREAQRTAEIVGVFDVDPSVGHGRFDEQIRGVRVEPTEVQQLNVAHEFGWRATKPLAGLHDGGTVVGDDPWNHSEDALESIFGGHSARPCFSEDALESIFGGHRKLDRRSGESAEPYDHVRS